MAVLHLCQYPYAVLKLRQLCKPHPRANHAPPSSLPLPPPPPLVQRSRWTGCISRHTVGAAPLSSILAATDKHRARCNCLAGCNTRPTQRGPSYLSITTADTLTPREANTFEHPSLPPIPPQLLKNIESGKYIDMGDLLPEALSEAFDRSQRDTKDDNTTTSRHKFHPA